MSKEISFNMDSEDKGAEALAVYRDRKPFHRST